MAHSIRVFIDPVRGSLPESDPTVQEWINVSENGNDESVSSADTRSTGLFDVLWLDKGDLLWISVLGQSEVGSNSSRQTKHSEKEEERA